MIFKSKYKEFVRIFLYKNGLKCIHIKEDVIINSYQCAFSEVNKIKLPIELIVHHRSMNCNSFPVNGLSKKEVNNLVHNTLEKNTNNNSQYNTIFYRKKKKKSRNSKLIQMCECDLDKEMLNVLNSLSDNTNISTTVFPIWVTANFINMYYNNTYEFTTNVFVTEYLDCWNIIVINNNRIIYNSSGLLESFNKSIEIPNTLTHIKNTYNINIDDIIIYEFGDITMDSFTSYYRKSMKMITKSISPINKATHNNSNNIIKIACSSCIGINLYFLLSNGYALHNLLVNKAANISYINNCNNNIVNDLKTWHGLHDIYYSLKNINYKKTLDNYIAENHTGTINNLHMQLDCNNNILCSVNV